jgi:hypothetical protein
MPRSCADLRPAAGGAGAGGYAARARQAGALVEQFSEGVALGKLHDQEAQRWRFRRLLSVRGDRCRLVEAVDRRDVGMLELGQYLGLALQARQPLGVVGKRGRQHLDGDVPLQPGVFGAIHLTHAALAQLGDDAIVRECRADFHGKVSVPSRESPILLP